MRRMKGRMGPAWTPRGSIVRALVAVVFAGLSTAACKDATGPEQLTTLTITPATATVGPGGTVQLTSAGTRTGLAVTTLVGQRYAVTSGGGSVNNAGLFTAPTTPGTSVVTVTCGGLTSTATITVTAGPLATIIVTPSPVTLPINTLQTFTAQGRDAFGNNVPITPVWTTTNPPGTIVSTTGQTAVFRSGTVLGTYPNSVTATAGGKSGSATVIVIAGPATSLVLEPEVATLAQGAQTTFTAVGRDAGGNIVPITATFTVVNGGGTVPANSTGQTVVFTAGSTAGTFTNTVRAALGALADSSTVIVTAPAPPPGALPPPVPAAGFRFIARVAFTCTNASIAGNLATERRADEVPPGSVTRTLCTTGTAEIGTPAAKQAYADFLTAYAAREATACGTLLTGTLAGVILPPGVYCFANDAVLTGTLTLSGPSTGQWLFKIGSAGVPGALTGTGFNVVMAGGASACNVEWWVRQASTMVDSNFQGHILAGAGISFTRGTYKGNAWSKEDVTVTGTQVVACNGTLP